MLKSEREKLDRSESEFLSIGITENGERHGAIGIPWESTAHAFNMRLPQVYISPDDINDRALMERLTSYKVIGLYIWAHLPDYSFISGFKLLQDVSIKNGDAIEGLDFLSDLTECRMLYLQNARLKDLEVIASLKRNAGAAMGRVRCLCLDNCRVSDISCLQEQGLLAMFR